MLTRVQIPMPRGDFEGDDVGISHSMLSISVPIGRPQKQSSVILNFPTEKSTCDAASRQDSLITCYCLVVEVRSFKIL